MLRVLLQLRGVIQFEARLSTEPVLRSCSTSPVTSSPPRHLHTCTAAEAVLRSFSTMKVTSLPPRRLHPSTAEPVLRSNSTLLITSSLPRHLHTSTATRAAEGDEDKSEADKSAELITQKYFTPTDDQAGLYNYYGFLKQIYSNSVGGRGWRDITKMLRSTLNWISRFSLVSR